MILRSLHPLWLSQRENVDAKVKPAQHERTALRADRKALQIESLTAIAVLLTSSSAAGSPHLVDFAGDSGPLALPLAALLPWCTVTIVDVKNLPTMPPPTPSEPLPRRVTTRRDVELTPYGSTDNCRGCGLAAENSASHQGHTEACRVRVCNRMAEDDNEGSGEHLSAAAARVNEARVAGQSASSSAAIGNEASSMEVSTSSHAATGGSASSS